MKTLLTSFKNKIRESRRFTYSWRQASLLLLFMSSFTSLATAQNKIWDKTYGGIKYDNNTEEGWGHISGYSNLTAMVTTPDGGYVLAGYSDSPKGGDKSEDTEEAPGFDDSDHNWDYWVVKIDKAGRKVWDKTFSGGYTSGEEGDNSYMDILTSIVATPDGGFLLGGYQWTRVHWLIKIDENGNKIWEKTYELPDYFLVTLVSTSDGGFLLASDHGSLLKIDEKGNQVWQKKLVSEDKGVYPTSLITTPDDGYLVGGKSTYYGSEDDDYLIVKLDSNGSKEWNKTFGGSGFDYLSSLVATSDGGYLLGGISRSSAGGDKSEASRDDEASQEDIYAYRGDYWIIKINSSGTKVWDKTLGGEGYDGLSAMLPTPDGGYLLGGYSNSNISGDKSEANRGITNDYESDYWVVKINSSGTKMWDKTLGGTRDDKLTSLIATLDGSYLVGGSSNSEISDDKRESTKGVTDYWVIKLKDEAPPVLSAWNRRYGDWEVDKFTDAIKTADGGYLAGGYSNSGSYEDKSQPTRGQNDYWIVKSDKNGQKQWDKDYGGTADDFLNRVIQTQDGGYLLGGSSLSAKNGDKSQNSRGGRDYWVIKLDKQGLKQWDKRFGGSGYDELKKVIQLATGEYVLGGYSNSPASGDKSQTNQGGTDYWLVKISATGTKIWDKRYGGSLDETLGSFTETRDGGFLLGGSSLSGSSGDKSQSSQGNSDYWVVRTDKDGNLLWEKTFGGSGEDKAYSIGRSFGDDFFLSGTSTSGKGGDKSQASQGGKDYWLLRLDGKGTKLWDKTFGGAKDDELRASTFTEEGYYIIAGSSFSGVSGDKTQASQGSSDYWLVTVDAKGNKVNDKRFGGSGQEELRTVFQTNDGGLLLGGRSNSDVSGDKTLPSQGYQGLMDYWLIKIAPESLPLVATREVTLAEEPKNIKNQINWQASPNPFAEQVTVRFTLPETQTAQVKVYDSQGREIITLFRGEAKANQTYQVEWQAGHKVTGMYLLQLQTPTQRHQQKLLLAR